MKKTLSVFLALLLACAFSLLALAAPAAYVNDEMGYVRDSAACNALAAQVFEETGVAVFYVSTGSVVSAEADVLPGEAEQWILLIEDPNGSHIRAGGAIENRISDDAYRALLDIYLNTPEDEDGHFDNAILAYISLARETIQGASSGASGTAGGAQTVPYVRDDADLLTDEEEARLEAQAKTVSEKYSCTVAVLTTRSLDGKTATAFADDFYDYNGYGYGADHTGIMFMVCPEERDWAITTTGGAIPAFTDYGQDYLFDQMRSDLSADAYADAFATYLTTCDELLAMAEAGEPMDGKLASHGELYPYFHREKNQALDVPKLIAGVLFSMILAFFFAAIPMKKLKNEINNVHSRKDAVEYTRPGSLQLSDQRDVYLYTNTSRTARPKETSSSRGGSSTHVGSSGTTHGGSSGKY